MVLLVRFLVGWAFTLLMSGIACALVVIGLPKQAWLLCCRPWARTALRLVGTRVDLVGAEYLGGPALFASNHQSLIDALLLPALLPRTLKWIAKRELWRVPFWGWALGAGGAVFIDRAHAYRAIRSIRAGIAGLHPGWSIGIFPEGTRSKDGKLGELKKGVFHIALQSGLPIVPIGQYGGHDIVPPGGWLVRPGTMFVTVGKPIPTTNWTPDEIETRMQELRAAIESCMNASQDRYQAASGRPTRGLPAYEVRAPQTTAWPELAGDDSDQQTMNSVSTGA